jgi:hypothetical protein
MVEPAQIARILPVKPQKVLGYLQVIAFGQSLLKLQQNIESKVRRVSFRPGREVSYQLGGEGEVEFRVGVEFTLVEGRMFTEAAARVHEAVQSEEYRRLVFSARCREKSSEMAAHLAQAHAGITFDVHLQTESTDFLTAQVTKIMELLNLPAVFELGSIENP